MRRHDVKDVQRTLTEYQVKTGGVEQNGNAPSPMSPTNSVGSQVIPFNQMDLAQPTNYDQIFQGSGSNTPPCLYVPLNVHNAFLRQCTFFSHISSALDLWEQADNLVKRFNHTGNYNMAN